MGHCVPGAVCRRDTRTKCHGANVCLHQESGTSRGERLLYCTAVLQCTVCTHTQRTKHVAAAPVALTRLRSKITSRSPVCVQCQEQRDPALLSQSTHGYDIYYASRRYRDRRLSLRYGSYENRPSHSLTRRSGLGPQPHSPNVRHPAWIAIELHCNPAIVAPATTTHLLSPT